MSAIRKKIIKSGDRVFVVIILFFAVWLRSNALYTSSILVIYILNTYLLSNLPSRNRMIRMLSRSHQRTRYLKINHATLHAGIDNKSINAKSPDKDCI